MGAWCDVGGTLPPPVVSHPGDHGAGKITEPGAFVEQGSVFSNVTVRGNQFVATAASSLLLDGAPRDQAAVPSCEDAGQKDTDKNTGKRLAALKVDLQSGCCSACLTTAGCDTWVFATDAGSQGNNCWLMNGVQSTKSAPNRVRGWAASRSCSECGVGQNHC